MEDTQLNRKLTSILYADIAGYSKLSGADEEGTHRRVMQVFDAAEAVINKARGSIVNSAGDAIDFEIVAKGTVKEAYVRPRTVVSRVIDLNASPVILAHNLSAEH